MVTELEEIYERMPERVRDHFFDSRLFPYMNLSRKDSEGLKMFKHHSERLGKRFNSSSEEYKIGLEYLTKLYIVGERRGR